MRLNLNINNPYNNSNKRNSVSFEKSTERKAMLELEKGLHKKMQDFYSYASYGIAETAELPELIRFFESAEEISNLCGVYHSTPKAKKRFSFPKGQSKTRIN